MARLLCSRNTEGGSRGAARAEISLRHACSDHEILRVEAAAPPGWQDPEERALVEGLRERVADALRPVEEGGASVSRREKNRPISDWDSLTCLSSSSSVEEEGARERGGREGGSMRGRGKGRRTEVMMAVADEGGSMRGRGTGHGDDDGGGVPAGEGGCQCERELTAAAAAAAPFSRTGDPAAQRLGDEATLHRFVVARDGDLAKVRRNTATYGCGGRSWDREDVES
eukprot:COSAG01_NODE_4739_length_4782_cov_2.805467_8_plen_227_part_00